MVHANYLLNEYNWCWLIDLPPIRVNFEVPMMLLCDQNHISMGSLFVQSTNDSQMVQLNVMLVNWLSMLNAYCMNDGAVDLPKLMMLLKNLLNANVMLVDLHLNDVLVNVDERPLHECFVLHAYAASHRFVLGSI